MNLFFLFGFDLLCVVVLGDVFFVLILEMILMCLFDVEFGYVKFLVWVDGWYLNLLGGVYGGFVVMVFDLVIGCVVYLMFDVGVGYGIVDLYVKMLWFVLCDVDLIVEGCVIYLLCLLGVVEGMLKMLDDKIVVYVLVICFI